MQHTSRLAVGLMAFARNPNLDSQALTALGAARIDHGAAATGFHANQETVGTCAADFGGLVSAFHVKFLMGSVQIQQL